MYLICVYIFLEATILTIQITEIKPKGGAPSTHGTLSDYFTVQTHDASNTNTPGPSTPSAGLATHMEDRRLDPRRKPLVVYEDTPTLSSAAADGKKEPIPNKSPTTIKPTPNFDFLINQDTDVPPPVVRDRLIVEDFPKHSISTAWIKMVKQGLSEWLRLPVIVCRGTEDG